MIYGRGRILLDCPASMKDVLEFEDARRSFDSEWRDNTCSTIYHGSVLAGEIASSRQRIGQVVVQFL